MRADDDHASAPGAAVEAIPEREESRPWQTIRRLLHEDRASELPAFIDALSPGDTALAMSRLGEEDRARLFSALDAEAVADILHDLTGEQAAEIIEEIEPAEAAAIFDELPADHQADLLHELPESDAAAILGEMDPPDAERVRQLLAYGDDTAGGIMIAEFLSYREDMTVGEVLDDLRAKADVYSDYEVQYAYIVDPQGETLRGVLRLRDVLLSRPDTSIRSIMIADPMHVDVDRSLEDMIDFFEDHNFIGVPVVDRGRKLVGVIRKAAVLEAAENRASRTFMSLSGIIGGEEIRTMPLLLRCVRRLAFLGPNIILNLIAVTVIARHEATLEAVIALAIFLPIVSDMSGCSGNQAVAVSIRELTLGLIRPHEFLRIVFKEGSVGIINGAILGVILGTVAAVWKGPPVLGVVIGGALAVNTVVSVLLGGSVPLLLRLFKIDPALASGPILTTVTDMCGFFLVLTAASAAMGYLVSG